MSRFQIKLQRTPDHLAWVLSPAHEASTGDEQGAPALKEQQSLATKVALQIQKPPLKSVVVSGISNECEKKSSKKKKRKGV